jgi:hypothetical protein
MTIYLPDELGDRVKAEEDINVSSVCQEALEAELRRRDLLGQLDDDMKRIVVDDDVRGAKVAFTGRLLAEDDKTGDAAYLTAQHRIALYDESAQTLGIFDNFDVLANRYGSGDSPLVAAVAHELGEDYVIELDI